jgi:hypothetical protein
MSAPRADTPAPASSRSRKRENLLITGVLAFQVLMPLSYYVGDHPHDERFSWRMFSTLRLRACKVHVTSFEREGTQLVAHNVDIERDVHMAWLRLLERMRSAVIAAYLDRRCDHTQAERVELECACLDTDGKALPPVRHTLDCQTRERH